MVKNFNEVLKEKELQKNKEKNVMSLDSTERIKVLSPGQMVFKRFVTNRLAIVGSVILIAMFIFAFIVPIFYGYGQTEIFYKYDNSVIDYAQASYRTEYSIVYEGDEEVHYSVKNYLTATITDMKKKGLTEAFLSDKDGNGYVISRNNDYIFTLSKCDKKDVASIAGEIKYCDFNTLDKSITLASGMEEIEGFSKAIEKAVADKKTEFSVGGETFSLTKNKKSYIVMKESDGIQYAKENLGAEFEALVEAAGQNGNFDFNNKKYSVSTNDDVTTISELSGQTRIALLTTYGFDAYSEGVTFTDSFKFAALDATVNGGKFQADGAGYQVKNENDEFVIYSEANGEPFAALSDLIIRRYSGEDTLEYAFKEETRRVVEEMNATGIKESTFVWNIAQVDSEGNYTYVDGELVKEEREVTVIAKNGGAYDLKAEQVIYLIDSFAKPSKEHIVGTDGDGMDVFARMMYGGRVSLLVAFIVVILENILGVILGGISGFCGGWVDNLIMRLVDIFFCIPGMPILIILGALFDAMKLKPYVRLAWLMAVLGILGWAGVARLVRGQILSLREQEFMVAAEAVGLPSKKRIFKHLVPNVMPQLIVTSTSGLGSVILTESTLSYLGLGVKHPLATWGTMISAVSTAESMKSYTYIWIPVGLLICLTVVAFNFVGDGLRDAFDPKMKR